MPLEPALRICASLPVLEEGADDKEWRLLEVTLGANHWTRSPDDYPPVILWTRLIWAAAPFRSLEIWKKLTLEKLKSSLAAAPVGVRSLPGKLGAAKGRYVEKDEKGNWTFLQFKPSFPRTAFSAFSSEAIEACRRRAQQYTSL